jgi:DNA-binding IclR family transcriptional regulator
MTLPTLAANSEQSQSLSPPTDRVVAVMQLLGARSDRSLTVTEIGRQLRISRATAHAILGALAHHDWVVRDADSGGFGWGPAIEALARPTDAGRRLFRSRLTDLSSELGMQVLLIRRRGTDMSVVEAAGETPTTPRVGLGFRVPFLAPFGREFAAWVDDAAQQAWLDRLESTNADFRSRMVTVLADIRGRGFAVERLSPEWMRVSTALQALGGSGGIDIVTTRLAAVIADGTVVDFLDEELLRKSSHEIGMVMAPVRNPTGTVTWSVSAIPLASLNTTAINDLGNRVRETAADLEKLLARYGDPDANLPRPERGK